MHSINSLPALDAAVSFRFPCWQGRANPTIFNPLVYNFILIKAKDKEMEWEVLCTCNLLGVTILIMIAAFHVIGVEAEKNADYVDFAKQD